MIIKYDKNKNKLKKPINFDLQDALKIDAKVFLNNIDVISEEKLKTKQGNYNKSVAIKVDNTKKRVDLWLDPIFSYLMNEDIKRFRKDLEDGWF